MTPMGLIKNYTAETLVNKKRIVSFGTSEGLVAQSVSDAGMFGVSGIRGAQAGERLDVYLSDEQTVEYGGPINYGNYVTADVDGRAIVAAPAVGVQMFVIGRALETGGVDVFGKILIQPQQITG
ncbi:MAG: hypothetical protein ABJO27_19145 [Pseudoruegeria sp.]